MKKLTFLCIIGSFLIYAKPLSAKEFQLELKEKKQTQYLLPSIKAAPTGDEGIKGRTIIGVNAGFNVFSKLLEARYYLSNVYSYEGTISSSSASPLYHLSVDYGFAERFSAGVDIGFQKATIQFNDVLAYGDSYSDHWTRILLAARADYHIVAKENMSLYTGLKFGYNMYTVKTDFPEKDFPGYTANMNVNPQTVSVQAHFGYTYFFQGKFGVNAEIGLGFGGPYLFSAGLAYKI
jgi:hypothetical protein